MNTDHFKRVEELFTAAAGMERGARSDFLTRECGSNAALRVEVEGLLAHDDRPADYLRTPVLDAGVTLREHFGLAAAGAGPLPERIGRYRPISVIGEGGFGVVYLAEQDLPRRIVALKVIRPGLATRNVLKRFEYEAQVLGRLHHPCIAQIYEAGTADAAGTHRAQAFVAMEYIPGKPLTEYAATRKLGTRQRLELMARICEGVQHAHQKGVIHRDLKPANILVVDADDGSGIGVQEDKASRALDASAVHRPRAAGFISRQTQPRAVHSETRPSAPRTLNPLPKILDFGVARATDPELSSATLQTGVGQLVGTLPYMSPEQVAGEPDEIDTRSDVYSLGVLLYELLAGRLPYDLGSSIPDAARIIRDTPPAKLSSINRVFRGEVDIIVAKALEKDKTRRYQSAADLADDIRRYLTGEPISARRDSALYILRKQLRRYWAGFAAAAAVLVLLASFGVYAWIQSRSFRTLAQRESAAKDIALTAKKEADDALGEATLQRRRADETATRLATELRVSNIERGRLFGRAGNILAAENLIWREHLQNPQSRHTFWALWELYAREPWLANVQAHEHDITSVRFVPNSNLLATSGVDGRIRLWDTTTWRTRKERPAHAVAILTGEISPDGRHYLTAARDGTIRVWALPELELEAEFDGFDGDLAVLAFSPDSRYLATGGYDEPRIRIYDMQRGVLVGSVLIMPRGLAGLAFSQDGGRLAAFTRDNIIRIYGPPFERPEERIQLRSAGGNPGPLLFSADGRQLYAGGADRVLRVWDLEKQAIVASPQAPSDTVGRLRLTPDNQRFVTTGWWSLSYWNPLTFECREGLTLQGGATSIDFSPDGRLFAYGTVAGQFRVFESAPRGAFTRFDHHETRCTAAFSPDGNTLATGDAGGVIRLWDIPSQRLIRAFRGHRARIHGLRFDAHGTQLVSAAMDREVRVWDLDSGQSIACLDGHYSRSSGSIAWSRDGRRLADMVAGGWVRITDTSSWQELNRFMVDAGEPLSLSFAPDNQHIAVESRSFPLRLFNLKGDLLGSMSIDGTPWTTDFSADGRLLATGTWGLKVELFDWKTFERVGMLEGHTATVWSVDFHPTDSSLLVSAASDGTVRLWDVAEQRVLMTLHELENSEVIVAAFSPDGRRILASNSLGTVAVWDVAHFERHIAGHVESQIARLAPELGDKIRAEELRAWAAQVQAESEEDPVPAAPAQ